jgi:hypothetical protein
MVKTPLQYQCWDLPIKQPPVTSRLYSLKPEGIGTPFVESLTGYITRDWRKRIPSPPALLCCGKCCPRFVEHAVLLPVNFRLQQDSPGSFSAHTSLMAFAHVRVNGSKLSRI